LTAKVRHFSARQDVKIADLHFSQNELLHKDETTIRYSQFGDGVEKGTTPPPVKPLDAYYGVLGDFVKAVEPHTEADPLGILTCLLCGVGNALGREVHHQIGRRHACNLFVLLCGETTDRKGTCWDIAEELLALANPQWADVCVENGFGSGEGLVDRIRDANGDDEGVADKRLLVVEEEFGKPLKLAKSEKSILSDMMRTAFDGKPLSVMNRGGNRYKCREPHIGIVGNITPAELLKLVKGMTAIQDGFLNRFLLCGVKRTRYLPQGSDWRSVAMRFAPLLREAMATASACNEPFALHEDATALWEKEYWRLEQKRSGDYGNVVARLSVHTLKVAMVYAVLDGSTAIRESHLQASLAVIAHAEKTALEVFGGSATTSEEPSNDLPDEEPPHAKLLNLIRSRPDGINKTDAHALFNRHRKADDLDADFRLLGQQGFIVEMEGRWYSADCFKGGCVVQPKDTTCEERTANGEPAEPPHADEALDADAFVERMSDDAERGLL
jgi:hypothetical protein